MAAAEGNAHVIISARIEEEISQLDPEEAQMFLDEMGLSEPGLDRLIRAGYDLLHLETYFTVGPKEKKLGIKGSPTTELYFENCRIPKRYLLGEEGKGVNVLMSGLDYERVVLAGLQLGIMQACLDTVIPYLRERTQFGKPIGSFQLMQAKVADMYVALQSARAYTYAVAKSCDAGQTTRFDAAGAILLSSENAFRVAAESVQALGGAGYTLDWPVERYMRDAKLLDIGAGTNEIRRMLIGRELIGAAG